MNDESPAMHDARDRIPTERHGPPMVEIPLRLDLASLKKNAEAGLLHWPPPPSEPRGRIPGHGPVGPDDVPVMVHMTKQHLENLRAAMQMAVDDLTVAAQIFRALALGLNAQNTISPAEKDQAKYFVLSAVRLENTHRHLVQVLS